MQPIPHIIIWRILVSFLSSFQLREWSWRTAENLIKTLFARYVRMCLSIRKIVYNVTPPSVAIALQTFKRGYRVSMKVIVHLAAHH